MARKKTIMKATILDSAYEVVRTEGFRGFTARNIATRLNCSTQPIYLEFKNMDDLKNGIYEKVYNYLTDEVYTAVHTGNKVVDTCLNYIQFAKKEPVFFTALFIEMELDSYLLYQISYQEMVEAMNNSERTNQLTAKEKKALFEEIWPIVHGTASLEAQGLMNSDHESLVDTLHHFMDNAVDYSQYRKRRLGN
ncbi:TetR/AcrR family transcriptional regulator [Lacticigenium naphthae]|uniref:TetR/AcrR family transcriptional regulator n=1 Tax=Lacticigenium naphthae TaxID=515351 RepID=UPI0004299A46|nr:TetR/AcrR family transcriptional regulator [Lacticigenium naphthae]